MTENEKIIIQGFKQMPWQPWLHRRFDPFVTYLLMLGATRKFYAKIGLDGNYPIALYDTDDWYGTDEMFRLGAQQAEQYLKQKDIFVLTKQCEDNLELGRREIPKIIAKGGDPMDQLKQLLDILYPANVYAWVAHGSEPYYHKKIREAVRGLVPEEELETFIGDISFPSKKNAMAIMEDDIRAGMRIADLHEKHAWIKARGGFRPVYSLEEIEEIREKVLAEPPHVFEQPPNIPESVMPLVKEVQELVYLRTLRTDALWEMYDSAQPIFYAVEELRGIESAKDFLPEDLISGDLKKIPHAYAMVKYDDGVIVTDAFVTQDHAAADQIEGTTAQKGVAQGRAVLLFTPADIGKVKAGDIIVTNMTIPAYIGAMRLAAGFVTDEGGITCHAAIIAREMKKPCVIGTKIATKVFAEGQMIEVDADKGIVRKL